MGRNPNNKEGGTKKTMIEEIKDDAKAYNMALEMGVADAILADVEKMKEKGIKSNVISAVNAYDGVVTIIQYYFGNKVESDNGWLAYRISEVTEKQALFQTEKIIELSMIEVAQRNDMIPLGPDRSGGELQ